MIVDAAVYREGRRIDAGRCEHPQELTDLRRRAAEEHGFCWVGLVEPSDAELDEVAAVFGLPPDAVRYAQQPHLRPRVLEHGEHLFLVVKSLWYVDESDAVETGQVALFVGADHVVTVRHGQGGSLAAARTALEESASRLTRGPLAVVHAVTRTLVMEYRDVVAALTEDVDEVEASVFSQEPTRDSRRIYTLKREIAEVRRAVVPLQDPIERLADGDVIAEHAEAAPLFRDLADGLRQLATLVDGLDGLLSTAFDAHLAAISVQQNDDMRKISAGAALVVVPTFVAGVYGMNFTHMPELSWTLGYPFALLLMAVIAGVLYWRFKRSGWL